MSLTPVANGKNSQLEKHYFVSFASGIVDTGGAP